MDIKEVRIVFDEEIDELQANLLQAINQKQIPAMVVSIVLFAIVALSLYLHSLRLEEVTISNIAKKDASNRRNRK